MAMCPYCGKAVVSDGANSEKGKEVRKEVKGKLKREVMYFRSIRTLLAIPLLVLASATTVAISAERDEKARWPYAQDLKALVAEVDSTYPYFDLKGIRADWDRTKQQVLKDAEECRTDEAFVALLTQLLQALRDAHMGPTGMKIAGAGLSLTYYPGISFLPATEGRVIVMAVPRGLDRALKPGVVVRRIDGKDARTFLEEKSAAAWKKGGCFSSPQRARLFEYRIPLQGAKRETHKITILVDGKEKELTLTSETQARGWPHTYNMPRGLTRAGRSCLHGDLPSGFGYIYLRRIDPSVEQGIAQAVEMHPNVKGWIIDLRGNGGGGYGPSLHAKLKTLQKPVACLIDEGCISAGETFARDIVRICDAKLFGSTTAGSSSVKRTWQFPSGIGSIVISMRSRHGIGRQVIEYNGIKPDVAVEAVPEEVQQGQDSCILRAIEYLAKAREPRT